MMRNERLNLKIEWLRKCHCNLKVGLPYNCRKSSSDLLAECRMSILSVKLVDQRSTPLRYSGYYKEDTRTRSFDHFFFASSTLKANVAGICSSGYAMEFYNNQAEKKLAKLIVECKEEE
jgi:hypothetical protein